MSCGRVEESHVKDKLDEENQNILQQIHGMILNDAKQRAIANNKVLEYKEAKTNTISSASGDLKNLKQIVSNITICTDVKNWFDEFLQFNKKTTQIFENYSQLITRIFKICSKKCQKLSNTLFSSFSKK